jgi:integrase
MSSNKDWARALAHAEAFFPKDLTLRGVDASIAVDFRNHLQDQPGRKPGSKMAAATVGKTCGIIKQAFDHAVDIGLIASNPFASRSIPKSAGANPARHQYVPRETVLRVIEKCHAAEDRIMLALARFGCLRMPSEIQELRWSDIDWSKREFTVSSPKTAHHGKSSRKVPLFPDLYALLRREFDAGVSSEFVLPTLRRYPSLSPRARRAMRDAGVPEWDKALQNLRASGEEDWLRGKNQPQDVALWCGHTPKVMYQHYMRIRDADSASHAALSAAASGGNSGGSAQAEVAAPVVTSVIVSGGKETSPATEAAGDDGLMEFAEDLGELVTAGGDRVDHRLMDLIGLEPTTSSMPWKRSSN